MSGLESRSTAGLQQGLYDTYIYRDRDTETHTHRQRDRVTGASNVEV